jgi:hypothetical protein
MFECIIVLVTSSFSMLLLWRKSVRKKMQTNASRPCTICKQRHCECLRDFKKMPAGFKKEYPLAQRDM